MILKIKNMNIFQKLKNKKELRDLEKLRKLMNSNRYKNSQYIIQNVNDGYAIKDTKKDKYIDLVLYPNKWRIGSKYQPDCIGKIPHLIRMFNIYVAKVDDFIINDVKFSKN
jgi:hypothetical protein